MRAENRKKYNYVRQHPASSRTLSPETAATGTRTILTSSCAQTNVQTPPPPEPTTNSARKARLTCCPEIPDPKEKHLDDFE